MLAIKAENISKAYQLGEIGTGSLNRDIERWVAKIRGKEDPFLKVGEINNPISKGNSDVVWSLKDINFEIKQGDAVGLVGRNGAGKSTLLKILSRVTSSTSGQINVRGRIASLLEVGTGFHPELTGRENIFLNGAILGMRKREIQEKFDEIVDFSGVERYIDTPVKRYSSGMYVRLAFAVAANLECEILIVDEVLAVGDVEFQKKCLGKMGEVSRGGGRTVLFVSHNMGSISQLCTSCILLNNGSLITQDNTEIVIDSYMNLNSSQNSIIQKEKTPGEIKFLSIGLINNEVFGKTEFRHDEEISVRLEIAVEKNLNQLELAMRLVDINNRPVFTIHEKLNRYKCRDSVFKLNITIPPQYITPGKYSWIMCINNPGVENFDLQENILAFYIIETGSEFSRYNSLDYGCVFARYSVKDLS